MGEEANGVTSNYDAAITTLSHVRQDRKTFSMFLEVLLPLLRSSI